MRRRKQPRTDLRLKVAILERGFTQRRLAHLARMGETKLSAIVHGRTVANTHEQAVLAKILGRPAADLFPPLSSRS